MRLRDLVWKELKERPTSLLTSGLTIFLGVASVVAIRHVTVHAEAEASRQLSQLGANVLVLPADVSLQDYYSADQNGKTLPEEHVSEILMSGFTGVEKVSPKLNVPVELMGQTVNLTGILPQTEFQAQAAWQTIGLFTSKKHEGCKKAKTGDGEEDRSPTSLTTRRSIEELRKDEVILGAEIAEKTGLKEADAVSLFSKSFKVLAVLPKTGTVDDSRLFAHLHVVQELAGTGQVVNAIEIIGCCEAAASDLVGQLQKLIPQSKVVTITQLVQTQVSVNRLISKTSWFVLAVLSAIGCATVAGAISANVRERRREIGTLMALGAEPHFVARLFLTKALWLGLVCGSLGSVAGIAIAMLLGPLWSGVSIQPLIGLSTAAIVIASGLALAAAYVPARNGARLDPCVCFQE